MTENYIGIEYFEDKSIKQVSERIFSQIGAERKAFSSKSPVLHYNHIIHRKIPKFISSLSSDETVILPSHTFAAGITEEPDAQVIALVHGMDALIYDICNKLEQFNFKRGTLNLQNCHKAVCLSERAYKQLTRYRMSKSVPDIETKVITQALEKDKFYPEKKNPKEISLPEDYILYAGSLNVRKNPEFAVDVAKETDKPLVIAGKTIERADEIKTYAEKKNFEDKIMFTGYLSFEDLRRTYSNAGIYFHPSLMEGYGRTPVEAAACGTKPIIHEDLGCAPDLNHVAETYSRWDVEKASKIVQKNFGEQVEYNAKTWENFIEEFTKFAEE